MIRMIKGNTRIGSDLHTAGGKPFSAGEATEKRLVSLGVAEYVKERAAPPAAGGAPATDGDKEGKNAGNGKGGNKGAKNGSGGKKGSKAGGKSGGKAGGGKAAAPAPTGDDLPEGGENGPALGADDPVV